jgi:flagellar biosynthesis protein FliR
VDLVLTRLSGEFAIDQTIAVAILVTARVMPLILLTAWLALRAAPNLVLIAVSAILATLLTPYALSTAPPLPSDISILSLLTTREILVGTVFAIAAALPFYALEWAGRLTDTMRDPSLTKGTDLPGLSPQTPLSNLYVMTGMVLFLSVGGHRIAITALTDTFIALPIGTTNTASTIRAISWESVRLVASALTLSVIMAAPIAALIALSQFALVLVGRSFPNLSLYLIAGIPLRALIALVGVLFCISLIIDMLPRIFQEAIDAASALLQRFAP